MATARKAPKATKTAKAPRKVAAASATAPTEVVATGDAPTTVHWMRRIDRPFTFGFLLTLGALLAVLVGLALSNLSSVIIYLVLALFFALGLNPAVLFMERHGIKRPLAVAIIIVGVLLFVAALLLLVLPPVIKQLEEFAKSIPGTVQDFMNGPLYADLESRFGANVSDALAAVQQFLSDPSNIANIFGGALHVAGAVAGGITGLFMVVILTIYFVAALPTMEDGLLRLAPAYRRPGIRRITEQIFASVGAFIQGQVVISLMNAVVVFVVFLAMGLPFPLLMAVAAFVLALIPMVGPLLMLVLGIGIALLSSPTQALLFGIIYFAWMQVEAYLIAPRILGKAVAVPGSLVVIGALAGGALMGLLGALLAVPITAAILIIINQVVVPKQDSKQVDPDVAAEAAV